MATQKNQFTEEELVRITRFDKQLQKQVETVFPKVGGRLRLAHEDNETLSIETTLIRFDDNVAVVSARCSTMKGDFHGMGTASLERDRRLSQSLLELAETRAISRALRFGGYGFQLSAEEMSHLMGNGDGMDDAGHAFQSGRASHGRSENNGPTHISEVLRNHRLPGGNGDARQEHPPTQGPGHGNGGSNGGDNGNGRITSRQHKYILNLAEELGLSKAQMNEQTREIYGVVLDHLSRDDASSLIQHLLAR